jgi:ornithine cyclodeaminase/alanine dehydrogenase-like protein (mu-crystallin family)
MLTRVAAQALLRPGAARAVVLGCGAAADLQLATIARHLPSIRQIHVCPVEAEHGCPIEQRALDEIDLAGVRLTVTTDPAEVLATADLVVVACPAATWPHGTRPHAGVLVVNTTNQDLPDELVGAVDELYVDDAELVAEVDRHFVRRGVAGQDPVDLNRVLAGDHPGRTEPDHVVLVELLSADRLDVVLARQLHRAAVERGLGIQRLE